MTNNKKQITLFGFGWLGKKIANSLSIQYVVHAVKKNHSNSTETFKNINLHFLDINDLEHINYKKEIFKSTFYIFAIPPSKIINSKLLYLLNQIDKNTLNKIIFISSTGVYKNANKLINESDESSLISESELLKQEELMRDIFMQNAIILRLGGLFGKTRKPHDFFTNKNQISNSQTKVNLIYDIDVVEIIKKIFQTNISSGIYNCCSDEHPTKEEFYSKAFELAKLSKPEFIADSVEFKEIDNQKIKDTFELKFTPLFESLNSCYET